MVEHRFEPGAPTITLTTTLTNAQTRRITTVLDTGTTYTMIPWKIAEALGYEPTSTKRKMKITTASGIESVPLVKIKQVSALRKRAKNVLCIVHDLPETSRVDGLLGLSYLRNFISEQINFLTFL